ncbi:hypothetical protein [Legionella sp.]|uniref:hypothetical protein n=1 Tax=Legionella sp. TaxID=459 RepID=UPI003CAD2520
MTPDLFKLDKNTPLAVNNSQSNSYYVQIVQARTSLLKTFQNQLAEPLTKQLVPEKTGVPFLHVNDNPPQIAAIKKVINCLYHAEEAGKAWEKTNFTSALQGVVTAPQTFSMLYQLYKSLAHLNEATPEIQSIILNNHELLSPIFSNAYKLIKSSGWLPQFSQTEVVSSANKVLHAHENMVVESNNIPTNSPAAENNNFLISAFDALSELMNTVADLHQTTLSETERRSKFELMHAALEKFEKIPFVNQLSLKGIGDAQAFKSLMDWLTNINDNTDFMQKSMQNYIFWTNNHLPSLIIYIDELERNNYLKPGLLSSELTSALSRINSSLIQSSLKVDEKQFTLSDKSLIKLREERIDVSEVSNVKTIVALEKQHRDLDVFIDILKKYAKQAFSVITETDRYKIRQIYPQIQSALAHNSLELENELALILNEISKDEELSWTEWSLNKIGAGVGYFSTYLTSSQVDKFLAAQESLHASVEQLIKAEKLKIAVAENAREFLSDQGKTSIQNRVNQRISVIKSGLHDESEYKAKEIKAGELVAVKASSLKNLRGNIAYLQELQLSDSVHKTRITLTTELQRRLGRKEAAYFATNSLDILEKTTPEIVRQLKLVENSLLHLEETLKNFERLEWSQGYRNYLTLYAIVSSARKLYSSVELLSPEARKYIAPVIKQIDAYGILSTVNQHNGDLSSLGQLKQVDIPAKTATSPSVKPSEVKKESLIPAYIDQIETARTVFLQRLQETLAKTLASQLMPEQEGVPFAHLDKDAPQVAAIKKVINGLYHAEQSLRTLQHISTGSTLNKVSIAHQGVTAVSQLYKSFTHLIDVAPEVQNLIRDNYDLLEPIFSQVNNIFSDSTWFSSFKSSGVGSFVGYGINAILPENEQSFSLVQTFSNIPALLHVFTTYMQPESEIKAKDLKISQKKLKAINKILDGVATSKISLATFARGRSAYKGLMRILTLLGEESGNLKKNTFSTYQQWVHESYPDLLAMVDELETRYYLQSGTLSKSIAAQIDSLNQFINLKIDEFNIDYKDNKLEPVQLSVDFSQKRAESLGERKKLQWTELFKIEHQKQNINDSLQNKSSSDLSSADRKILKQQEVSLIQQEKACKLKIDVITEAITQYKKIDPREDAKMLQEARNAFYAEQSPDIEKENRATSLETSSVSTLETIKKLDLPSYVAKLRTQLHEKMQSYFSERVQKNLKKLNENDLYIITSQDPSFVRQMKELDNNLYHLQAALVQLRQIKPEESLLSLAKVFAQIGHHAQHLITNIKNLSPELKEQYGSLVEQVMKFSKEVLSLDYKKAYTPDIKLALEGEETDASAWLGGTGNILQTIAIKADDARAFLKERYAQNNLNDNVDFKALNARFTKMHTPQIPIKTLKSSINKVYVNLVDQIKKFDETIGQLGSEVKNIPRMKEIVYKEFLVQLSQQEDTLYLKPGTFLKPAMAAVNQFFLATALELDMSFNEKLNLLNEVNFLNMIGSETKKELAQLTEKLKSETTNSDLQLQVELKKDKLDFLTQESKLLDQHDQLIVRRALLDSQFEVYLRKEMKQMSDCLNSPILEQYEEAFQHYYFEHGPSLAKKESPDLLSWINNFKQLNQGNYWLVSEGIAQVDKLKEIANKDQNVEVKNYLKSLIASAKNEEVSIETRAETIKKLPSSSTFNRSISALSDGANLWDRFKQFIETAVSTLTESLRTGGGISEIYNKKKTEKIIQNIEKFHTLKKELGSMKAEGDEEQKNLRGPSQHG